MTRHSCLALFKGPKLNEVPTAELLLISRPLNKTHKKKVFSFRTHQPLTSSPTRLSRVHIAGNSINNPKIRMGSNIHPNLQRLSLRKQTELTRHNLAKNVRVCTVPNLNC